MNLDYNAIGIGFNTLAIGTGMYKLGISFDPIAALGAGLGTFGLAFGVVNYRMKIACLDSTSGDTE